jgi:hypothetical protein
MQESKNLSLIRDSQQIDSQPFPLPSNVALPPGPYDPPSISAGRHLKQGATCEGGGTKELAWRPRR